MLYLGIFSVVALVWCVCSKLIWHNDITFKEVGLQLFLSVVLSAIVFGSSYYANVNDYETLNGEVKEKVRDNDSHQESYSCNCRSVRVGKTSSTQCSTCWRTVYTVDWDLKTTIGSIHLNDERSYSSSVWNTADPIDYVKAYVGEPCSKKARFVNYIKGANRSLFNTGNYGVAVLTPIPAYPELLDDYHLNSVLNVGTQVDIKAWNLKLRGQLKTLSTRKGVNVIIVFVNSLDPNYRYKVEKEWGGGKKNDYVVIIGTTDNTTAQWVDGFTFGLSQGNYLMLSEIGDELRGKPLNEDLFISTITAKVSDKFVRKSMKDFEYLAKEIRPSDTALFILMGLQLILNIGFTIFNIKNDYLES